MEKIIKPWDIHEIEASQKMECCSCPEGKCQCEEEEMKPTPMACDDADCECCQVKEKEIKDAWKAWEFTKQKYVNQSDHVKAIIDAVDDLIKHREVIGNHTNLIKSPTEILIDRIKFAREDYRRATEGKQNATK